MAAAPTERELSDAGLLDGLNTEAREQRLAMLHDLAGRGVGLAEMREAAAQQRLGLLQVDRVLAGPEGRTIGQLAADTGVPVDTVVAMRRALGFARPGDDEAVISAGESEGMRIARALLDAGLPPEQLLDFTRILGRNLAQAADSLRGILADRVPYGGDSDPSAGLFYARLADALSESTGPALGAIFNGHLRQLIRSDVVGRADLSGGSVPGTREVTVCFADLVGFTRLGQEVPPDELGAVATRLGALAADAARPPVRLVKMIGDAAMFVGPVPAEVVDTALTLLESAESEGERFPQLRAGCARGMALNSGGDWFGTPVNLASRVTAIARHGSLLATQDVHDAVGDVVRWSWAGRQRLKGIDGEVGLYRGRRLEAAQA